MEAPKRGILPLLAANPRLPRYGCREWVRIWPAAGPGRHRTENKNTWPCMGLYKVHPGATPIQMHCSHAVNHLGKDTPSLPQSGCRGWVRILPTAGPGRPRTANANTWPCRWPTEVHHATNPIQMHCSHAVNHLGKDTPSLPQSGCRGWVWILPTAGPG